MNGDVPDQRPLLQSPQDESVYGWSHVTGQLLYTFGKRWGGGVGDSEAYAMRADGTGMQAITPGMSDVAAVSWHPDGKSVMMASNRRGNDNPQTVCGKYRGPKQENTKGEAPLYDIVALENGAVNRWC